MATVEILTTSIWSYFPREKRMQVLNLWSDEHRETPLDIFVSVCTWKGSRRKQHQEFHAIPFSRKMEIIEEMNESIRNLREQRLREKSPGSTAANLPSA